MLVAFYSLSKLSWRCS